MNPALAWGGLAALAALPLFVTGSYYLHVMILILLWGFIYTGWSIMGRFGLVSLGHGAFIGIGAYGTAMLWNFAGLTPWLGIPITVALSVGLAALIGWPCFRFRIVGHYFALVTLALAEVVALSIVALRDTTGGSLGLTPERAGDGTSLMAFQFADRAVFFWIALGLWAFGIWVWGLVDRSMARDALDAISENEDAAASIGIDVTRTKMGVTMMSAALAALGGGIYCQYQMYVNPGVVAGIGVSLQIVFAVVAGGMFVRFGPTVGAVFTIVLAEGLRSLIGNDRPGVDTTIYGLLLILFIVFMPKGILGAIQARLGRA
jgi:branched-chain amino acid transport system permease protein